MTKVATGQQEASILDVIREMDAKEAQQKVDASPNLSASEEVDPAKLRESLREKLEIVAIVKNTKYAHLIAGSCGESIDEIQKKLQTAIVELDELGGCIEA